VTHVSTTSTDPAELAFPTGDPNVDLLDDLPRPTTTEGFDAAVRAACARIAPLWPLESFVAVNPYLGLVDRPFAEAAEVLADVAGAASTLPAAFYLDAVDAGRISTADLVGALAAADPPVERDPEAFLRSVRSAGTEDPFAIAVPTVAAVATEWTGHDWDRFSIDRVSAWAAAYFDEGQALWRSADRSLPLFVAWKEEAGIDRTPEVMGLRGFRAAVRSLPDDPAAAARVALDRLAVPCEARERYLHAVLLRLGGWSGYAARIVWDHQLVQHEDDTLLQFASVLLAWEVGLLEALSSTGIEGAWAEAMLGLSGHEARSASRPGLARLLVLQDAFDRSQQRLLVERLAAHEVAGPEDPARPDAQAVFCIDVRSEVLRRHLEAGGGKIDTIGFAGFFGIAIEYLPIAHDAGEAQCPVLLTAGYTVQETVSDPTRAVEAVEARRLAHHVRRAWKSFKMGAISCFSFVGPVGLLYLPKLFTDGHGRTRPIRRPDTEALPKWAIEERVPTLAGPAVAATPDGVTSVDLTAVGIPLDDRVDLAAGALGAMSLTEGFGRLVLIAGHGASTVNNPYDTGLDCGACGGHTGEANARVAVAIFNDAAVRIALAERGIVIPTDTWFVAAQHDTTTDEVTVFDRGSVPASHAADLAALEARLAEAGAATRRERARRMGLAQDLDAAALDAAVVGRSTDWAQVRPEWGLAGCRTFIVAPRSRTRGLDLGGQSFLHSYDWRKDDGFGVLELVMTAPMVVASWISLQYYGSTVDNRLFGSGNKTLHNVVGRLGVLEGNGGDLRPGLPWQSVHDGESYQHEPLRLNVVIEAPLDAMTDVIAAHPGVRDLLDNGWLNLLAMDDTGSVSHRYAGDLVWEAVAA
jgi:uncharacterized protein YbcC (UPF0753/DUF2309 family)